MTEQPKKHTDREASPADADKTSSDTVPTAVTEDGQPLALEEGLDTSAKAWEDIQKDKYQYDLQGSFPGDSEARTTFYAREASDSDTAKFDRLFGLQHGRGHTFEEWDGQRIRQEDTYTYRRACVILSQAEVSELAREQVLQRVVSENLNGFSRYYNGVDGAALGFACHYQYDSLESAKESHIAEAAAEKFNLNAEKLLEYIWRKYGGEAA